ncbi:hypothetical protein [Halococcus thailandensis]|uniref:Uncharacterized protein n=1 Tax=Halococcus thailandensis JCM 13552 TaxID=1227457 RepID=M0N0X9_9EURY|nr:hypothetical protein [Halococcus thailandensis]EMA50340.1 hypothetical protein C451_17615 [Halococcus thailandensis JCM 13552]
MNKLSKWILIDGNRLLVSVLLAAAAFLITFGATQIELITFQPASAVSSMFGSGVVSGLFSVITITLTVNQLVLSRVFGTVEDLTDRLDGTREFRQSVAELTGRATSPNDPAAFLALIGETLDERVEAFATEHDGETTDEIEEYRSAMHSYAERLEGVAGTGDTMAIVSTLLGPAYAQRLTETETIRQSYDDRSTEELDAVTELLEAVAVARQFFKTIAIQQDLAQLSRRLATLGIPILLVAFYATTVYTSVPSTTVAQPLLPIVVSAAIAIVLLPLAILLSYMLRLATIARYTVSVGPFVPPEEQT